MSAYINQNKFTAALVWTEDRSLYSVSGGLQFSFCFIQMGFGLYLFFWLQNCSHPKTRTNFQMRCIHSLVPPPIPDAQKSAPLLLVTCCVEDRGIKHNPRLRRSHLAESSPRPSCSRKIHHTTKFTLKFQEWRKLDAALGYETYWISACRDAFQIWRAQYLQQWIYWEMNSCRVTLKTRTSNWGNVLFWNKL